MKRTLLRNIFSEDGKMENKKFKDFERHLERVETHLPNIKNKVSEYSSKKNDEVKSMDKITSNLLNYANSEIYDSLKVSITEFVQFLNEINQNLAIFNDNFNKNVVNDLAEFKVRSKHLRNDLKTAIAASEQEKFRQRQLQRLQMLRDQDGEKISLAEAELLKAKAENLKASSVLEQNAEIFEHKKLMGLRSTFLTWTTLELKYHARALELFTNAYRAAAEINVDRDIEEFRTKMHAKAGVNRLATVEATTRQHMDSSLQKRQDMQLYLNSTPIPWSENRTSSRLSSSTFDSSR